MREEGTTILDLLGLDGTSSRKKTILLWFRSSEMQGVGVQAEKVRWPKKRDTASRSFLLCSA